MFYKIYRNFYTHVHVNYDKRSDSESPWSLE
jgi:hypothetical protein